MGDVVEPRLALQLSVIAHIVSRCVEARLRVERREWATAVEAAAPAAAAMIPFQRRTADEDMRHFNTFLLKADLRLSSSLGHSPLNSLT
jgi:hypothetical protein